MKYIYITSGINQERFLSALRVVQISGEFGHSPIQELALIGHYLNPSAEEPVLGLGFPTISGERRQNS